MREIIRLNNEWFYNPAFIEEMRKNSSLHGFEKVNLPHTNKELPYNYFDENDFQFISCYKKTFKSPNLENKLLFIRFQGVMTKAEVYVNGNYIGEHLGGYTPFEFDITNVVTPDNNEITVVVDSRELENIPPFGGQIDYLTYGGIYRDVELKVLDETFIKNVKIETSNVLEEKKQVLVKIHSFSKDSQEVKIEVKLTDKNNKEICNLSKVVNFNKGANVNELTMDNISGVELWDLDNPNLYNVEVKINFGDISDIFSDRIGFRDIDFREDGFYLNNKNVKIIGINRHQAYPYVGYAMPKRAHEKDAEIIKNELHFNLVRTSHYPQSIEFLNKCDELGLLVFEEIPGWQHIGNKEWQDVSVENVKEMVERDWNHPSIIIWGVRINESIDNDDFYTRTNAMAKSLDTTRQTGGVRCIEDSNLLEDVYTMNDFILDGGELSLRDQKTVTHLDKKVPYLVTEYNGHMFPTKRFDNEERQIEHVNRHLRVQDASFKDNNISGAIAWCMFDYNTHNDFGAGDRICYHGIMDFFRIPKFASYVYKSQVSPKVEPVLKAVTYWARGERSVGGIMPLTVLTNCDTVELVFGNNKPVMLKRDTKNFPNLPYAPIVIDDTVVDPKDFGEWGMKWEDGLLVGYVDGKAVIEEKFSKNPLPTNLILEADDLILNSDEKDATRFIIKVTDDKNQLLPFFDRPVTISLNGPGKLHGPTTNILKGGALGFWIETINKTGTIDIQVSCDGFKDVISSIEVK